MISRVKILTPVAERVDKLSLQWKRVFLKHASLGGDKLQQVAEELQGGNNCSIKNSETPTSIF